MAPQQTLRTHRSLEAYYATLWYRRRLVFFCVFPCNWARVKWNWQKKTEVPRGKICPSATLSTTYRTWTDPGLNPCLRCERPATNRLSQGTAFWCFIPGRAPEPIWTLLRKRKMFASCRESMIDSLIIRPCRSNYVEWTGGRRAAVYWNTSDVLNQIRECHIIFCALCLFMCI
jgi:hypothetical protein